MPNFLTKVQVKQKLKRKKKGGRRRNQNSIKKIYKKEQGEINIFQNN